MGIFEKMAKTGLTKVVVYPDNSVIQEAAFATKIMKAEGHEKLVIIYYPDINLRAAIAIHDRTLGRQAIGGCRILNYSDEKEMLKDVLKLSKAMTYKAALAGLQRGGAKCVVWCDPRTEKSRNLFLKLAEEIDELGGEYITGEDMNVDEKDILLMRTKTEHVSGLPETYRYGKCRGSGDPSPVTARGIVYGVKACFKFLGLGPIEGKTVAIQGLGKVGHRLARFLYQEGAKLVACDINQMRINHFIEEFQEKPMREVRESARLVDPEDIFSQECDIFSPCAGGGALNKLTIPRLKCKIVAGSANNQLADPSCGKRLTERGILYAPDYVINAGGLINVDDEKNPDGYNELRVQEKLENIFCNLMEVFWLAQKLHLSTSEVADILAQKKIYLEKNR